MLHRAGDPVTPRRGRRLFRLDPAGHRAGRPDYPEVIYETLVERCGLGPTICAIEIRTGHGLVTQRLLREGAHVTAVEPDPGMASYLRDAASSPNLDVVISSFEDADFPWPASILPWPPPPFTGSTKRSACPNLGG